MRKDRTETPSLSRLTWIKCRWVWCGWKRSSAISVAKGVAWKDWAKVGLATATVASAGTTAVEAVVTLVGGLDVVHGVLRSTLVGAVHGLHIGAAIRGQRTSDGSVWLEWCHGAINGSLSICTVAVHVADLGNVDVAALHVGGGDGMTLVAVANGALSRVAVLVVHALLVCSLRVATVILRAVTTLIAKIGTATWRIETNGLSIANGTSQLAVVVGRRKRLCVTNSLANGNVVCAIGVPQLGNVLESLLHDAAIAELFDQVLDTLDGCVRDLAHLVGAKETPWAVDIVFHERDDVLWLAEVDKGIADIVAVLEVDAQV